MKNVRFKMGDRVKVGYLGDRDPYSYCTGVVTWVNNYRFYPGGNPDKWEIRQQGTVRFADGAERAIGTRDFTCEPSGLFVPCRIVRR